MMIINEQKKGQTFIEYLMLLGILVALLTVMTPMFKRGVQAMVKGIADQVGRQENAEQLGGRSGYLVNTDSFTDTNQIKNIRERLGTVTYNYIVDQTETKTDRFSVLGFREKNN